MRLFFFFGVERDFLTRGEDNALRSRLLGGKVEYGGGANIETDQSCKREVGGLNAGYISVSSTQYRSTLH